MSTTAIAPAARQRATAGVTLASVLLVAVIAGQAVGPMLVRTLRIDGGTAEKIA